jgi:hypothetical protein
VRERPDAAHTLPTRRTRDELLGPLENWVAKLMTTERAKGSALLRDFYRACRAVCGVDERSIACEVGVRRVQSPERPLCSLAGPFDAQDELKPGSTSDRDVLSFRWREEFYRWLGACGLRCESGGKTAALQKRRLALYDGDKHLRLRCFSPALRLRASG